MHMYTFLIIANSVGKCAYCSWTGISERSVKTTEQMTGQFLGVVPKAELEGSKPESRPVATNF